MKAPLIPNQSINCRYSATVSWIWSLSVARR